MRIGSLFSGIGGLELGLERAGLGAVVWQVEASPWCREVLARHWPHAERFDDVRGVRGADRIDGGLPGVPGDSGRDGGRLLSGGRLGDGHAPAGHRALVGRNSVRRNVEGGGGLPERGQLGRDDADGRRGTDRRGVLSPVDLICGGFPCQDVSLARFSSGQGQGAGLAGAKSGLWHEYARIIGEIRPRWVVIENVAALRSNGLAGVLGGLAVVRADWFGAPHQRARLFMVAWPAGPGGPGEGVAGPLIFGDAWRRALLEWGAVPRVDLRGSGGRRAGGVASAPVVDAHEAGGREQHRGAGAVPAQRAGAERAGSWRSFAGVCRVDHGVPFRVDRVGALGNAVIPTCAEVVGRLIRAAEQRSAA
jgi:DNA (cytosine-5)-methyltransferase 1